MNNNLKSRTSFLFTIAVIMIPILRIYTSGIPGIDLAELFLLLSSLVCVLTKGYFSFGVESKKIVSVVLVFLFITIFDIFVYSHSISSIVILFIRWSFYLAILLLGTNLFDIKFAKKVLTIVSIFVCIGLVIQMIGYYAFSKIIVLRIPFLRISDSMNETGSLVTHTYNSTTFRTSSFFSEPAHFAYFVCISLMVSLVLDKPRYILSFFYTACIVLSTSTGGILLAGFVWLYFLLFKEKKNRIKNLFIILLAVIILLVASYFTPLFNYFNSKLALLFESHGSSSLRTNLFEQLSGFSLANIITGVGFGNAEFYITEVIGNKYTYVSSISLVIMWTGIIGLIYFLYILFFMFKKSDRNNKVFVFIFAISLFGTGMITSSYLILFLIWPICNIKTKYISSKKAINDYYLKNGVCKYV